MTLCYHSCVATNPKERRRDELDNRSVIQKTLDYIEENLQTEITASELAEMAGFSLFHFYRLFQQATGLSVMQYILRRRLLHGIYAIKEGSSRIDAALLYGFDTYAGFYKAFCREFGSTPSEFLNFCRAKRPYRIDLTKEEHMIVTHKKAAQLLKNWNLEGETITDIYYDSTGRKHDSACYIGDNFVLKYTANLGKLKNHIEVSKALKSIGMLSAYPVATADGKEYIQDGELFFYVTRRIKGKQMASGSLYAGDAVGNARFVGEIVGQLHLALRQIDDFVSEADLLATVRDWALPNAKQALGLADNFCREYLDTFAALYPKLPRHIIHRDPNPGNIIRNQDQWGFIDFDLAERNARIYDPCYAATAVLSEGFGNDNDLWLDIYRNIICGYDSVARLTDAEREAIPYMILANQFVCVAWFAGQDKYAELFETNRKMTLWLIDSFDALKNI